MGGAEPDTGVIIWWCPESHGMDQSATGKARCGIYLMLMVLFIDIVMQRMTRC